MPNIDDFFNLPSMANHVSSEDKIQATNYIMSVDAIARTTYKSVYVVDYEKQGFDYVSDNPLFLCGKSVEEVMKDGYVHYFNHVPAEELELLQKINELGFEFHAKLPIDERRDYSISYDFHLINCKGEKTLVNHTMTPLFMNNDGELWKALANVALSSEEKPGNIKITQRNSSKYYLYDLDGNFWIEKESIKLTSREQEILKYSSRGFTVSQIAEEIFISTDTVKFHRKKIFEKLNVANITEAITFAQNNKLL